MALLTTHARISYYAAVVCVILTLGTCLQGSLEEKVYQRQISKQGLSGAVMDLKASDIQFSKEDLRVPITASTLE